MGGFIYLKDYFFPPLSDPSEQFNMYMMMLLAHDKVEMRGDLSTPISMAIYRQIYPEYWHSLTGENFSAQKNALFSVHEGHPVCSWDA
jgi:hypothetical protein